MASDRLLEADRCNTYIIAVQIHFHILGCINIDPVALCRRNRIVTDRIRCLFLLRLRYLQTVLADCRVPLFFFLLQREGDFSILGTHLNILRQRIIPFRLQMDLMDSVRQLHCLADIRTLAVYADRGAGGRHGEQNLTGLILHDLNVTHIQHGLFISFNYNIFDTADSAVGQGHLIAAFRYH